MADVYNTENENKVKSSKPAKLNYSRRRRWKKRIKIRAAKIKRQIQIENRFHQAVNEMRTTGDHYRQSYLHWILNQMFTVFDYETGLQAINDKAAYKSWLSDNGVTTRGNFDARYR